MAKDLHRALSGYGGKARVSFHTPGHKGRSEFFHGLDFPAFDLTELPGLDMLHAPTGVIAAAQARAAEVFGADATFFLVNGGTGGNQAMLMAVAGERGGNVLVERASHRSVLAALILTGLTPVYLPPVIHPDFHLPLGLAMGLLPAAGRTAGHPAAIHVTYPRYYGSVPDLAGVITYRDACCPQTPVLVDQAHGSHYVGELFPLSATALGADIVLHSTHKTLPALTQAAMLHVCGERVSRSRLRQALELLQSSSPSYLLLASLERAAENALTLEPWQALAEEVAALRQTLRGKLRLLGPEDAGSYGIKQVDWSKILVNTRSLGLPAPICAEYLRARFGIEPELWDAENILFVLGLGNTPQDVRLLGQALVSMAAPRRVCALAASRWDQAAGVPSTAGWEVWDRQPFPPQRLTPRQAFLARKRLIPLRESLGQVAGETISPYPPGVPLVVMGEEMTPEVLELLMQGRAQRWQGWEGFAAGQVWVVEQEAKELPR